MHVSQVDTLFLLFFSVLAFGVPRAQAADGKPAQKIFYVISFCLFLFALFTGRIGYRQHQAAKFLWNLKAQEVQEFRVVLSDSKVAKVLKQPTQIKTIVDALNKLEQVSDLKGSVPLCELVIVTKDGMRKSSTLIVPTLRPDPGALKFVLSSNGGQSGTFYSKHLLDALRACEVKLQ